MSLWKKPITTNLSGSPVSDRHRRVGELILQVGHLERFNPAVLALQGTMRAAIVHRIASMSPFPIARLISM